MQSPPILYCNFINTIGLDVVLHVLCFTLNGDNMIHVSRERQSLCEIWVSCTQLTAYRRRIWLFNSATSPLFYTVFPVGNMLATLWLQLKIPCAQFRAHSNYRVINLSLREWEVPLTTYWCESTLMQLIMTFAHADTRVRLPFCHMSSLTWTFGIDISIQSWSTLNSLWRPSEFTKIDISPCYSRKPYL